MKFDPYNYMLTHSMMKPPTKPTRNCIVDNVFEKMKLIREDIDYDFVKQCVYTFLDKNNYKDEVCNNVNPMYLREVEI